MPATAITADRARVAESDQPLNVAAALTVAAVLANVLASRVEVGLEIRGTQWETTCRRLGQFALVLDLHVEDDEQLARDHLATLTAGLTRFAGFRSSSAQMFEWAPELQRQGRDALAWLDALTIRKRRELLRRRPFLKV